VEDIAGMKLHTINDPSDPLLNLIDQDPVRPHIPVASRVGRNAEVLVLMHDDSPVSVVCVSYTQTVPVDESQLFDECAINPSTAVLYTIWSLQRGGGQLMIEHAADHIRESHPSVSRMVTLSPLTSMARNFHTRNGARELQVNAVTVNFEYDLD
jgi:hypothetical protein